MTPRFLRHFAIFSLVRPAEISLTAIFTVRITIACTLSHLWVYLTHLQAITKGFFTEFPQPVKEAAESIVKARYYYTTPHMYALHVMCVDDGCSVEIYGRMSTDLLPTPAKSHYIFNLRDLSKCIQGQSQTQSKQCDGTWYHTIVIITNIPRGAQAQSAAFWLCRCAPGRSRGDS